LRASSLSHAKIISLLNGRFVPVYARNGDYRKEGSAADEEKTEYTRIYHEAIKAKLSTGTVHVYIVAPDGHPIDSMHVAEATKPDKLLAMMERSVEKLKVPAGEALVKPAPQSATPPCEKDSLVLHLTTRYLSRQGDDYLRIQPVLGTERSSQWASLPSEEWVVLGRAEWSKLLPSGEARPGTSWEWDKDVSAKLLTNFYPPTENTDTGKNRIDQQTLKATVLSVENGVVRARVEGSLKMKHPFYHKDTNEMAEANLVGIMEFEPGQPKIRSLRLVTDKASYGAAGNMHPFGVAVRSVP
jgi:hypothetical protein